MSLDLTELKAKARGTSPGFPFKYARTNFVKSKQKIVYNCCFPKCQARRIIHKLESDPKYYLFESGKHIINGVEHGMVRRRVVWSAEHITLRDRILKQDPTTSPSSFLDILQDKGYDEFTLKQVQGFIKRYRIVNPVVENRDTQLVDIVKAIADLKARSVWEASDPHRPLLLPTLGDQYIFEGEDVTENMRPSRTLFGNSYAFCIPVSTHNLLTNRERSRETKVFRLSGFTDAGPQFEETANDGFQVIDGVFKMIKGDIGVLLVIGTVTRNTHFRLVGYALVHGETSWAVARTLHAFDLASEKLGLLRAAWCFSDSGPAMLAGIRTHCNRSKPGASEDRESDGDSDTEAAPKEDEPSSDIEEIVKASGAPKVENVQLLSHGTCSVHLFKDNIPKKKKLIVSKEFYPLAFLALKR